MERFEAMRLFTRIVELGSFSRAAEQLGVTRAAATQGIQQLEARLGVSLLARTTRQVTATVDGQAYYQRCSAILADLDDAEAEFSQATRQPRGRIRVDLPGSLCRLVLMPALPDFCARYPQVRVELSVSDRQIDPLREGVDCVLRIGELGDLPLVARRLASLTLVTCASRAYLDRCGRPRSLAELEHHRAVDNLSATTGKPFAFEFVVDGAVRKLQLPASIAVNDGGSYVAACAAGMGLIQVPLFHVERQLAEGELEEILPQYRPPPMPLHLLYAPKRQPAARLRVFMDWVAQLFGEPQRATR
jgi:LysR family transcriptional regulator, regulator for bpeEF and oprC